LKSFGLCAVGLTRSRWGGVEVVKASRRDTRRSSDDQGNLVGERLALASEECASRSCR
jgi:hypothetical protein